MSPIKDGKPKRPMSAYMFFATEERPKVKKIQPTWSILEIAKELGQRWNILQAPQKARFEDKARKDKERYEREGGGRKERKGPKRPQSAYMFFVQDERVRLVKQYPTWTVPQVGSELGKRWRALTAAQKKKYEAQAAQDKIRYEREMGRTPATVNTAQQQQQQQQSADNGSSSSSPGKAKKKSASPSSSSPPPPPKKSKKAEKSASPSTADAVTAEKSSSKSLKSKTTTTSTEKKGKGRAKKETTGKVKKEET